MVHLTKFSLELVGNITSGFSRLSSFKSDSTLKIMTFLIIDAKKKVEFSRKGKVSRNFNEGD